MRLEKVIRGGLKSAINDHGPIVSDNVESANKRICGQVKSALRDLIDAEIMKAEKCVSGYYLGDAWYSGKIQALESLKESLEIQ